MAARAGRGPVVPVPFRPLQRRGVGRACIWRRGAFAVVDAPPARQLEAAVGGLVDGFQPALQLMPNYATCATLLRSDSIVVTKLVACSQHLLAAPTSSAPTTRIRMAGG